MGKSSEKNLSNLTLWDKNYLLHPDGALQRHRDTGGPIMVAGQGVWLWDSAGNQYLDGTGGLWLCQIGHGRSEMADVAYRQTKTLEYFTSFWDFTTQPTVELAAKLVSLTPAPFNHVFFTSGGSESVESALKMIRRYHILRGQPNRRLVISRNRAYHGVTWGALGATGLSAFREQFGDDFRDYVYAAAPYRYRCELCSSADRCTLDCVTTIETLITQHGPENIAAFIGEPVLGAGGMIDPPHADYWPRLAEILHHYNIPFILDEVVTGFGRTGRWFAMEHWGLQPDIITVAKGLASGYAPIGAVLVGDAIADTLYGSPDAFYHGHTYSGHPVASALALKNLEIIERERLVENASAVGAKLLSSLQAEAKSLPFVGEVRGFGMMLGIELVQSRTTKEPLMLNDLMVTTIFLRNGLIVRPVGNSLVLSPPLSMTMEEAQELIHRLVTGLHELGDHVPSI
ncbi:MAG: aspartate aminotransferase family protein [Sulfobacillus benefaciens]|uniref:Aspartate aminotransferase family protein n=1 Tax=Sulfobacillus benefaciens TaxID=453960 RepID=A0A2T2XDN5_9FIRM|nr:MAG: aspartate aminotransferase family protein [Sulfobacillus benefaciens]